MSNRLLKEFLTQNSKDETNFISRISAHNGVGSRLIDYHDKQ